MSLKAGAKLTVPGMVYIKQESVPGTRETINYATDAVEMGASATKFNSAQIPRATSRPSLGQRKPLTGLSNNSFSGAVPLKGAVAQGCVPPCAKVLLASGFKQVDYPATFRCTVADASVFTVGLIATGSSSAATGTISELDLTNKYVYLINITDVFSTSDTLTDSGGGSSAVSAVAYANSDGVEDGYVEFVFADNYCDAKSISIEHFDDGSKHCTYGARGSLSFNLVPNDKVNMQFDAAGKEKLLTYEKMPKDSFEDTLEPPLFQGTDIIKLAVYDGAAVDTSAYGINVHSCQINVQNEVVPRPDTNEDDGLDDFAIVARSVTGNFAMSFPKGCNTFISTALVYSGTSIYVEDTTNFAVHNVLYIPCIGEVVYVTAISASEGKLTVVRHNKGATTATVAVGESIVLVGDVRSTTHTFSIDASSGYGADDIDLDIDGTTGEVGNVNYSPRPGQHWISATTAEIIYIKSTNLTENPDNIIVSRNQLQDYFGLVESGTTGTSLVDNATFYCIDFFINPEYEIKEDRLWAMDIVYSKNDGDSTDGLSIRTQNITSFDGDQEAGDTSVKVDHAVNGWIDNNFLFVPRTKELMKIATPGTATLSPTVERGYNGIDQKVYDGEEVVELLENDIEAYNNKFVSGRIEISGIFKIGAYESADAGGLINMSCEVIFVDHLDNGEYTRGEELKVRFK